jgi:hypothetical protein
MYTGQLKKVSGMMTTQGTFSLMPRVGHSFKIDNTGPMGGEMTSNVTAIISTDGTSCKFKTIDAEYILLFVVDIQK